MNHLKANQNKKKNPYVAQEEKMPSKRLKPKELITTYKFEPISNKIMNSKIQATNKALSFQKFNQKSNLLDDDSFSINNEINYSTSLPQFRSTNNTNENEEKLIKNEEILLKNTDSIYKNRNSISINDIRITPLKELINRTKSRKDLKHLFLNKRPENFEQKQKEIEDLKRELLEVNQRTLNSLVKLVSKNNENINTFQARVIEEVDETIDKSILKEDLNEDKRYETDQKSCQNNNNESFSTDTKYNYNSSLKSKNKIEQPSNNNEGKINNEIDISNSKISLSEPSMINNNIQNTFERVGHYDELVIETVNKDLYFISKDDVILQKLPEININKTNENTKEIEYNIDINFIPSKKRFVSSVIQEAAERLKFSPDQSKLNEKEMLKRNIQDLQDQVINLANQIKVEKSKHKNEIFGLNSSMKELMNELETGELLRRKLHTYIQELRGSIRVFCRVKPVSNELENEITTCIKYPELVINPKSEEKGLSCLDLFNNNSSSNNNTSFTYHFDRVFPENSKQIEIFNEVKPFIQSALDGENVCIFAYGPTGSGKTFTMQGPSFDTQNVTELSGILPRAAEFIFDELTRLQKMGFNFKLYFAAMEVYNENIFDLLNPKERTPLQTYSLKNNNIQVKNLIWIQIKAKEDISKLTKEASETRRSDSTKFNSQSSRSHAIFQIRIEGINRNNVEYQSLINIIDLAGSERNSIDTFEDKSKSEVENMKKIQQEANFINKSLTTLGRIINMLGDKNSNKNSIPYRESKLTMILQNSLKPGSKTAMIVNICSAKKLYNITKEALNFAKNAMMTC